MFDKTIYIDIVINNRHIYVYNYENKYISSQLNNSVLREKILK